MAKLGREDISSTGRTYGEELKGSLKKDTDFLKEYAAHLAELNDLYDEQAELLEERILKSLNDIDEFIDEDLKKLETSGRSLRDIRDLVSDMLNDLRGTGKVISEREKSIRNFRDLSAEIEQSLTVEGGARLKSLESLVKKAEKQKELNRYTVDNLGTINQQKKAIFDLEDKQLQARRELRSLEKQYAQKDQSPSQRSKIFDQIREQRSLVDSLNKELILRKRNIDLIDLENRGISDQLVQQAKINLESSREVRGETGLVGGLSRVLEKLGMPGASSKYEEYVQAATRVRSLGKERSGLEAEQASLKGKRKRYRDKETGQWKPTATGLRAEQINSRLVAIKQEEVKAQEALNAAGGNTLGLFKNILVTGLASLSVAGLAVDAVRRIWAAFKDISSETAKLQQNIGKFPYGIAAANTEFASSKQYLETANELTQQFGQNPISFIGQGEIARLAEAKNLLGLSAEQAGNVGIRSKIAGQSISRYNESIVQGINQGNALNRSAVAHGIALKEVLSTSDDITLSLGNSGEKLGKAIVAAKNLGMSLKDVDNIAGSLLNFEASIENEMKAQLLTGHQMNLSKARGLALQNDLEGVARELANQGMTAAKFSELNRIQQESYASALGISREQLGRMLVTQAGISNLTDAQVKAATNMTTSQLEAMSITDRWKVATEKLAGAFTPLLEVVTPAITILSEAISTIAGVFGHLFGWIKIEGTDSFKTIGKVVGWVTAGLLGLTVAAKIASLFLGKVGIAGKFAGLHLSKGLSLGIRRIGRAVSSLTSASGGIPVLLSFGAAVLMVGGAVALAGKGIEFIGRGIKSVAQGFAELFKSLSDVDFKKILLIGPAFVQMGLGMLIALPGLFGAAVALGPITRRLTKLAQSQAGVQALAGSVIYLASAIGILKTNLNGLEVKNLTAIRKQAVKAVNSIDIGKIEAVSTSKVNVAGQENIKTTAAVAENNKMEKLVGVIADKVSGILQVEITNWDYDKIGRQLAIQTVRD